MGHAAEQHAAAAPFDDESPKTPNTYGGRVPLQPELGPGFRLDEQLEFVRRMQRRRRSPLSRTEMAIVAVILAGADHENGRYAGSTMGLATRARCHRSQLFRVLQRLEALEMIEEREQIDPCFERCTHTIVKGWKGFDACNRMREAARRQGRPFACVAHHGQTIVRWKLRDLGALQDVVREVPPTPVRRPSGSHRRGANATGVQGPYETPYPGSWLLKTDTRSLSSSPGIRPGARARGAHEVAAPEARPAGGRESGALHEQPASEAPHVPAPQSIEGGRARSVPPAPPAADVEAVLDAHREHALGTTLAREPASTHERDLVIFALAAWTLAELVVAMRGVGLEPAAARWKRRLVYVLSDGPTGRDRVQHAIDAWREHERALERAARPRDAPIQVVRVDAVVRARRDELAAKRADLHMRYVLAEGNPREQLALEREFEATFGEPMRATRDGVPLAEGSS